MHGSMKKMRKPSKTCMLKRRNYKDNAHARMDVSYPDDSNDSGIGVDVNLQLPGHRESVLLDAFVNSPSDDLDRDSSNDSIDSGVYILSSPEGSPRLRTSNLDSSSTLLEESGLANLLCQAVSISEEVQSPDWENEQFEIPNKRPRMSVSRACSPNSKSTYDINSRSDECRVDAVVSEGRNQDTSLLSSTSMPAPSEHMSLLGIAPLAETPIIKESNDRNSNGDVLNSSTTLHNPRRKNARKLPSLHISYPNRSKDSHVELRILSQPEEQHRARYMTEGSRGAVKDRRGTGFPTVKLVGYNQPVTLQVFIGTDQGKIQPHLFYQACKVSGKNCTPCTERMIDGTAVIEIAMVPEKDMTVSCDCIGILKERNVDVEQRLPYFSMTRAKKKNTRCRMIFRVNLPVSESNLETLQVASSPILCTQPPGIPEISKKSLSECSVDGGIELFIIGKNFLKDTKVIFQELKSDDGEKGSVCIWQELVEPEKEFLHQTHLVCSIPAYPNRCLREPLKIQLLIQSGGKASEPHTFTYLPTQSGMAADNLSKSPELSQGITGLDINNQLTRTGLEPAIIQVPIVPMQNGFSTILLSQPTPGIVTLPQRPSADNNGRIHTLLHPTKKVATVPPTPKVGSTNQTRENGDSVNQIHVVVVQQDKNGVVAKRSLPPVWSLNNNRHRFGNNLAKKLGNRAHGHLRNRHQQLIRQQLLKIRSQNSLNQNNASLLSTGTQPEQQMFASPNSSTTLQQSLPLFKQETLDPPDLSAEMQDSQLFENQQIMSSTIQNATMPEISSNQDLSSQMSSAKLLQHSLSNQSLQQSEILTNQPHLQQPEIMQLQLTELMQNQIQQPEILPSQASDLQNKMLHSPPLHTQLQHAEILQTQSLPQQAVESDLISTNSIPLEQQELLQNDVLHSNVSQSDLVQSPTLQTTIQPSESLPATDFNTSSVEPQFHLADVNDNHSIKHQSQILQQQPELPSTNDTIADNEIPLNQNKLLSAQPQVAENPAKLLSPQPLNSSLPLDSLTCHTMQSSLQPSELIQAQQTQTSEINQEPSIHVTLNSRELQSQLMSTNFTSNNDSTNQIQQTQQQVVMLPTSAVSAAALEQLKLFQQQNINISSGQVHSNVGTLQTSETRLNSTEADSSLVSGRQIYFDPAANRAFIIPSQGNALIKDQLRCVLGNQNVLQVTKPGEKGEQCEMTSFQNSMTNALTQLSEADLLSLINPSTFDNV